MHTDVGYKGWKQIKQESKHQKNTTLRNNTN